MRRCGQNELYLSPSWDMNPLTSINGRANVMSLDTFRKKYPNGKVPRKDAGKVFVCRRGCNTRTATYTEEFIWEDIYSGTEEDIFRLVDLVKGGTKATRRRRQPKEASPDAYDFVDDGDAEIVQRRTPKKPRTHDATTPSSRRSVSKSMTPSHRKYGALLLQLRVRAMLTPKIE